MADLIEEETSESRSVLSPELFAKAKEELGEKLEEREVKLAELRAWMIEEMDLKTTSNFDDLSLLWFLRSCKYNMQKTQKRIKSFIKFRASVPEWYLNRDPQRPELLKLLSIGCFIPLPGRDKEYHKVILIRAAAHNPRESTQDDVFKICNMVMELTCRDDESISVTGTVAIVDLAGISLAHVVQLTPSMIRKAVSSWQDVYPVRMKGMHYVNAPFNINMVLNIFKQFMKEKLRQRLHVHRSTKTLSRLVPADMLPPEYGGEGKSLSVLIEETKALVLANREWFLEEGIHGPFS